MNLCDVGFNEEFTISKLLAHEPIKSRLLAMGFTKGNRVSILDYTITRATYEVLIEDSRVAIRKEEAETIIVGDIQ